MSILLTGPIQTMTIALRCEVSSTVVTDLQLFLEHMICSMGHVMITSVANTSGNNWDEYQCLTISTTPCVHSRTYAVQNLTNLCWNFSFPDEQAGELPLAYVVKREHVDLTETEVMSFVARMVRLEYSELWFWHECNPKYLKIACVCCRQMHVNVCFTTIIWSSSCLLLF